MSEHRELPDNPALTELRNRFLNSLGKVRPALHRFCARMCGSVLDGEDLVQETLAAASYKVSEGNQGFLDASLFRMALERCRYFIRRDLGHRESTEPYSDWLMGTMWLHPTWITAPIDEVLASRVSALRPDDRAVVVFKDVLGFSIADTMELFGATAWQIEIALHRARVTLRKLTPRMPATPIDSARRAMLQAYADCFNRLDARGIHRLVRADARVEIVGAFSGRLRDLDSIYAGAYAAIPWEWRQVVGVVDGDPVLITSRRVGSDWHPHTAIRLWWEGDEVVRIRDYMHIEHILRDASVEIAT